MRMEVVLYFYGAVCASMILFNLLYALSLRQRQPRLARRVARLEEQVDRHLALLADGRSRLPADQLAALSRSLGRWHNLMAFDQLLQQHFQGQEETRDAYLRQLQPAFLSLAMRYREKEPMQAAYFAYVLSRCWPQGQTAIDTLQQVLLDYLRKENLYCRLNALKVLCCFGSPACLVQAIQAQDDGVLLTHEKLLTETLLTYQGDHHQLISTLWRQMDRFTPRTQLALLNYIRFRSGQWGREMLALLAREDQPKELRLAAIRYFGRYVYPPALDLLLAFARDQDPSRWEYTTVAVTALARYPQPRVVNTLKQALRSGNWYIRSAAAQSLEEQQVDYTQLLDIMSGSDRYAREMITYHLQTRQLRKEATGE